MTKGIMSYFPDWGVWLQAIVIFVVPFILLKAGNNLNEYIRSTSRGKKGGKRPHINQSTRPGNDESIELTGQYDSDIKLVQNTIGTNSDVHFREFMIEGLGARAAIIYVDGLTNAESINTHIIKPLMREEMSELLASEYSSDNGLKLFLEQRMIPVIEVVESTSLLNTAEKILTGYTALLVDHVTGVFIVSSPTGTERTGEEPLSEALIRGPRLGFTERIGDNTGLLRLHGRNQSLQITQYEVGNRVKKDLVIAYMKDIADPQLVEEVQKRIQQIDIDDPLESGYIEQLIEDNWLSPFQQLQNTERPDRVIAALLEGRVAILLDGTPFALIAPVSFSMLLQSPEDYYERWIWGTFIRIIRYAAAFLALLAPALYISFISFHPGLIPTKLALTIINTREGVPFPSIIEALIMELAIEILREAGIRLPKPVGPAMGIVGGLIIGEAAVQAGIVSPFLVIVVAVTAISSFSIPSYSAGITLRVLRFAAMFSAAAFGLFGVIMFFLLMSSHLVRLKSFGMPYAVPMVSYNLIDWKDYVVRAPLFLMKRRPSKTSGKDKDRMN
ncbi:spore germination protein [Paenibacillus sp. PDC88]|nr:spore germination protein [Paenibacillus sp. PDC88]SDX67635.1 spore germination protein [Paenibacillus sp. PDC88]